MNHFGIVTGLRSWQSGVRIPAGQDIFLTVQTCNWAHPAFCKVGTGGKADAAWSCHLRLASRFRMSGAVHLLPLWAFMAWTGTALRLAADTSSLYCPLFKRMLLTWTAWVESFDPSDVGRERTYSSCKKNVIWPCFHLSFYRGSFIKSLKSNLCTSVTQ